MTADQIITALRQRFGSEVVPPIRENASGGAGASGADGATSVDANKHPHVVIDANAWVEVARFLRDEPDLKFDFLRSVSGVDYPTENRLTSVYELISTVHRHTFAVKVNAPRDNPHVPSVAAVWPAADWHEREAFDLLGIVYDGHPNLVRILLPDDWVGHALLKDYVFPTEYNGMTCSTEPAKTTNP